MVDRPATNSHLFITERPHEVFGKEVSNHKIKSFKRQQELLLYSKGARKKECKRARVSYGDFEMES